ncbi:MAG: phosphohistidine phosphatase SixA [Verrucomicrobiota bacterium]|nr:phosphohistidine phosphatase SixA [Limisphaera sp.]MDW8381026.1 phosphohistidine phosphatase SixA [Verrucomicrobiota bacterium]
MKLYLLRHAEAEEAKDASPRAEASRALTSRGRRKVRSLAHALRELDIRVEFVWTSPLTRARQTAEIVVRGLRLARPPLAVEALLPDRKPEEVVAELERLRPLPETMLWVGHEPHLSRLIAFLVTGHSDGAEIVVKKCGLCRLELDTIRSGRCARLEWLIPPRWFAGD